MVDTDVDSAADMCPSVLERVASCSEGDLTGKDDKDLSTHLGGCTSKKRPTETEGQQPAELSDVEAFKLRVYEAWIHQLKQRAKQDATVYLVATPYGTGPGRSGSGTEPFESFFKTLRKRLDLDEDAEWEVADAIRKCFGFFDRSHWPKTLPKAFEPEDQSAADGDIIAYKFNNKLEKYGIEKLEQLSGDKHNTTISYLRHGHLCEELCTTPHRPVYDEYMTGAATHFPIISSIPLEKSNPYACRKTMLKLIENGLLRIGIADERCCDYLAERPGCAKELAGCGVFPIKDLLSFASQILDKLYTKRLPDVIIIHQGILDKTEWNEWAFEGPNDFMEKLKERVPFVVVTSGRGEPNNLPQGVKFLGFSIIERYILSDPHSKLLLSDAVMKLSRKPEVDK